MDPTTLRRIGNTRVAVPILGLGGSALGGFGDRPPVGDAEVAHAYRVAWDAGVRYFDTAPRYGAGRGERLLGAALRGVPRDAYRLSTKVGILEDLATAPGGAPRVRCDYGYEATLRSVEGSLRRLGTDRVDMVFVHDIGPQTHGLAGARRRFREALDGALPALAGLRAQGTVGAIGVGIGSVAVCIQVLEHAAVDVFMLAARYTLLDRSAFDTLLPMCEARGVSVIVAAPFNSGILAGGSRYEERPAAPGVIERVQRIDGVSAAHGVATAALALQFPLAHPAVAAVVAGARDARQVAALARWFRQPIPAAAWRALHEAGAIEAGVPVPPA